QLVRFNKRAKLLRHTPRFVFRLPFNHYYEFLAADAIKAVGHADTEFDDLGESYEYLVADGVAKFVVDLLEVVDVDEDQGGRRIRTCLRGAHFRELLVQCAPVTGTRQRVLACELQQLVALAARQEGKCVGENTGRDQSDEGRGQYDSVHLRDEGGYERNDRQRRDQHGLTRFRQVKRRE